MGDVRVLAFCRFRGGYADRSSVAVVIVSAFRARIVAQGRTGLTFFLRDGSSANSRPLFRGNASLCRRRTNRTTASIGFPMLTGLLAQPGCAGQPAHAPQQLAQ